MWKSLWWWPAVGPQAGANIWGPEGSRSGEWGGGGGRDSSFPENSHGLQGRARFPVVCDSSPSVEWVWLAPHTGYGLGRTVDGWGTNCPGRYRAPNRSWTSAAESVFDPTRKLAQKTFFWAKVFLPTWLVFSFSCVSVELLASKDFHRSLGHEVGPSGICFDTGPPSCLASLLRSLLLWSCPRVVGVGKRAYGTGMLPEKPTARLLLPSAPALRLNSWLTLPVAQLTDLRAATGAGQGQEDGDWPKAVVM